MNFLAHQYLSFQIPEIQLGNLYGEIVRGKDYLEFENGIRTGILLHRQIDTYTDAHDSVKNSSQKFHAKYGKYAPVIVDVVYDYILIQNWEKYSQQPYNEYVNYCYELFRKHFDLFPSRLQFIIKHLLEHDWFHNYTNLNGIRKTLEGISQRSKFPNNIGEAVHEFQIHQPELEQDFELFFPELTAHCRNFLKESDFKV